MSSDRGRPTRLREWRERRFLSQAELARLAAIQRVTVTRIENGDVLPQRRTIRKLAKALKIGPEQLLEQRAAEPK